MIDESDNGIMLLADSYYFFDWCRCSEERYKTRKNNIRSHYEVLQVDFEVTLKLILKYFKVSLK